VNAIEHSTTVEKLEFAVNIVIILLGMLAVGAILLG
jgi:hypothetical protein